MPVTRSQAKQNAARSSTRVKSDTKPQPPRTVPKKAKPKKKSQRTNAIKSRVVRSAVRKSTRKSRRKKSSPKKPIQSIVKNDADNVSVSSTSPDCTIPTTADATASAAAAAVVPKSPPQKQRKSRLSQEFSGNNHYSDDSSANDESAAAVRSHEVSAIRSEIRPLPPNAETDFNSLRDYLFDHSCIYSLLEVYLIAFSPPPQPPQTPPPQPPPQPCDKSECVNDQSSIIPPSDATTDAIPSTVTETTVDQSADASSESLEERTKQHELEKYGLWKWLWMWERQASAHHRILITPVPQFHMFEVRVDNTHGHPSGLEKQLKMAAFTFEYYHAYSRGNLWGGWKFYHNRSLYKSEMYSEGRLPPIMWKNVIWIRQIEMEIMQTKSKYLAMKQSSAVVPLKSSDSRAKQNAAARAAAATAQIFDNDWYRTHHYGDDWITMNASDVCRMLGTKLPMLCGQCGKSEQICRAINICPCFKPYFATRDLFNRHKALVLDWER